MEIINEDTLFEMANLSPKRTGLKVTIWSDNDGKVETYLTILQESKLVGTITGLLFL